MFAQFLQAGSSFLALVDRGLDRLWPAQALSDDQDPAQIAAWRRPSRLLFLAVLLCGLPIAMNRAIEHKGASDFVAFYDSARYLMEHGTRSPQSEMARYLPSADVPWLALAILPVWLASMVYYLLGCWSWIGLLDTTGRHLLPDADETTRRRATFLTGLLVAPLAVDGLCLGTFHIFMVWLMVAGLARAARGQIWSGGGLLGLAVWLKLLPALGLAYLVWKRRWKPAAIACVCAVALDVVLSVAGYGPRAAWNEHVKWWHDEGSGALSRQIQCAKVVDEDRLSNQSVAVLLRRLLTQFAVELKPRNLAALGHLTSQQLAMAYFAVMGLLGSAVAYYCRRPAHATSRAQWPVEIALMLLGTMWFSPVVWSYWPTAVVPAMAIVLGKEATCPRRVRATALIWLLAMALFAWPLARVFGQMMLTTFFLGAMLVWVSRPSGSSAKQCCRTLRTT